MNKEPVNNYPICPKCKRILKDALDLENVEDTGECMMCEKLRYNNNND